MDITSTYETTCPLTKLFAHKNSSTDPYKHLIKFLAKFLEFFFKHLLKSVHKVTVEICPNFYSGLLKSFLASF